MRTCRYCRGADKLGYVPDQDGFTPGEGWICVRCAREQRDQAQAVARYLLREWTDPDNREAILASLRAEGIGVPDWLDEREVAETAARPGALFPRLCLECHAVVTPEAQERYRLYCSAACHAKAQRL